MTLYDRLASSAILPRTARVNDQNHLIIGGCDAVELAEQYGTPLYLFDEATLRQNSSEFVSEFSQRYPNTLVVYASKAYINRALALIFKEEGLGLDVVSGGEIAIANSVDFPLEKVYFHGNNKTPAELRLALELGVGRIVVDNFHELSILNSIARDLNMTQPILLRLSPGVDAHTHQATTTGILDSKFGFPIATGQAEMAITQALSASNLELIGVHMHLGSPIFELEPYQMAIDIVAKFAGEMREKHGLTVQEFSPGGGFAIQYTSDAPPPPVADYADGIIAAFLDQLPRLGQAGPRLIIEPGRAIVGRAAVALYTVGAMKEIPGVRKYVSVDGGMADNIRPAIYGSKYEALVANKVLDDSKETVTIAGKFCESGDILIKDIELPRLAAGDVIAIPSSGAYCPSMASNYNAALKPAILLLKEGKARLIRRRETYEDLIKNDLL